jgi:predicted O-linked N-acetylglucosamine transferase (SPINDLY family)
MTAEPTDILAPAFRHYKAGRLDQAEALARRVLQKNGPTKRATLLLAQVLRDRLRTEQAVFEIERGLKADPGDLELLLAMGSVRIAADDNAGARAAFDEATTRHPESGEAWSALGVLAVRMSLLKEAEGWLRRSLELRPHHGGTVFWLSQALSGMMRTREAVELLRAELKASPVHAGLQQALVFLLQYVDDATPEEVAKEHKLAGRLTARMADSMPPRVMVDPDPERRLTIGYLSPDFRGHSCAYFIEPLLEGHDRSRVRLIGYSNTIFNDDATRRIRSLMDEWREVTTIDDPALAAMIARDRVDVAIDLAGHSKGARLPALALRPAPVCVTYLGYPNTTGMPGMDYRIVDSKTDPPGAEALSTETLLRLDPCFLCYRPLDEAPAVAPAPCAAAGRVTFGSFNIADKISPKTAAVWSRVLLAVPGSRLLLKSSKLADPASLARLLALFESNGVGQDRIEVLPYSSGVREHLGLYSRMDIALDTFPYNGTTTTCEALWMGVPVVALEGTMHAGRVGVSLLSAVGLPELIAKTPDEFVRIATGLASDRGRLGALRAGLRERMAASPLRDAKAFAARFEGALREVWRAWCEATRARRAT